MMNQEQITIKWMDFDSEEPVIDGTYLVKVRDTKGGIGVGIAEWDAEGWTFMKDLHGMDLEVIEWADIPKKYKN